MFERRLTMYHMFRGVISCANFIHPPDPSEGMGEPFPATARHSPSSVVSSSSLSWSRSICLPVVVSMNATKSTSPRESRIPSFKSGVRAVISTFADRALELFFRIQVTAAWIRFSRSRSLITHPLSLFSSRKTSLWRSILPFGLRGISPRKCTSRGTI